MSGKSLSSRAYIVPSSLNRNWLCDELDPVQWSLWYGRGSFQFSARQNSACIEFCIFKVTACAMYYWQETELCFGFVCWDCSYMIPEIFSKLLCMLWVLFCLWKVRLLYSADNCGPIFRVWTENTCSLSPNVIYWAGRSSNNSCRRPC